MDKKALADIALSVRSLSMDAIQAANSGHPGLPLGAAELGAFLYGEALKSNPADPAWLDRDRFVLSAGHGSMFLYSLLHMAGYGISIDEIKKFRQLHSRCAGHPEYGMAPGIETTTGPLGQGVANAVGMAIAESMLEGRFNTAKHQIFNHYSYALVGDGCLMEGVSAEASSLAGHLELDKLIVFYDSNRITIDGSTDIAFTEDVGRRYEAYGWKVLKGDMYDFDGLERMLAEAKADKKHPKLIILKSIIGKGSPNKQGTAGVHGSPLGPEEIALAKANLGIPKDAQFWVAPGAYEYFKKHGAEQQKVYEAWKKEFAAWQSDEPALAKELDTWLSGRSEKPLSLPHFEQGEKLATRAASGKVLQAVAEAYPNLVGGSADLTGPNVTKIPGGEFGPADRSGRTIHFGIREHGMAAIANGMALSGCFRPFVATFLVFADYLRPSLRLAALMKLPVIYVLTHDSIYIGEDGPTHQPIEALAALRAIPNVRVFRPADAEETAQCWRMAMERKDGPTILALTRQGLEVFKKEDPDWTSTIKTGAYVVRNSEALPETVVVATGSEVGLALKALDIVERKGRRTDIRLVSMPSRELFLAQPEPVREALIPAGARVVTAEAGISMGWEAIASTREDILAVDRFGESAPGDQVAEDLGFTAERLALMIQG